MWGWRDRIIGIVLGAALGVGVIVAFVFFFSEQTVDAPSLSSGGSPMRAEHRPGQPRRPSAPGVATIRIARGEPPAGGPPDLRYARGDEIRLRVVSDRAVEVELAGYGLTRAVPANRPTEIAVRATRPGAFALIDADSHIDVARITVAG